MADPSSRSDLVRKFGRYILTGGCAAIVDLVVFRLLHPAVFGIAAAATGSFVVAALFNYGFTSTFVYRQPLRIRQLVTFLLFATVGLLINVATTYGVAETTVLPAIVAKVFGIGAAFMVNFAMNTFVVFGKASKLETVGDNGRIDLEP